MRDYLTKLIEEKGKSLETEVHIEGHIGLTYENLVEFLDECPEAIQHQVRTTLVKIDFQNGDVFHYLDFLTKGMVKSMGYEV
jgi:hypothetical protein